MEERCEYCNLELLKKTKSQVPLSYLRFLGNRIKDGKRSDTDGKVFASADGTFWIISGYLKDNITACASCYDQLKGGKQLLTVKEKFNKEKES